MDNRLVPVKVLNKKPFSCMDFDGNKWYDHEGYCPNCNQLVIRSEHNYCNNCGQALRWE